MVVEAVGCRAGEGTPAVDLDVVGVDPDVRAECPKARRDARDPIGFLVAQFARAMIQADQLGISLSRILRVQSQDMRTRRQLAAEEKAMKAPVKMLFPTVLFIFPALFVVALGPAALNLMKTFSGG